MLIEDAVAANTKKQATEPKVPLSIWRVNYLIGECKDHRLSSTVRQAPLFTELPYVLSNGLCLKTEWQNTIAAWLFACCVRVCLGTDV